MSWWQLEALLALLALIGIVWWTMFSGRPGGELPRDDAPARPENDPSAKNSDKKRP